MRRFAFGLGSLFLAASLGCGGAGGASSSGRVSYAMSSAIVDEHGAHVFSAPRAAVFAATEAVLRRSGFRVDFADQAFTVLRTEAIVAGDPTVTSYLRSYNVTFADVAGGTRVRAAPRMFLGGQDVSATPVWTFDGPSGEFALWNNLFREIDVALSQLSTRPAP